MLKIALKLKSMINHIYFLFGKKLMHYCIFTQLSSFKTTFPPSKQHLSLTMCWLLAEVRFYLLADFPYAGALCTFPSLTI